MPHDPTADRRADAAIGRIRTYLRFMSDPVNLGAESAFSPEFRSKGWDHAWYPLTREDVEIAIVLVDELKKQVAEQDRALDEVIGERDRMHEVADELAYAVAPIEVIGEHSSHNNPWENALEMITPATKVDELTAQRDLARDAAVELENENARQAAELAKYVGKEPTVAEEMQYLNRCLNAVYDLCDAAEQGARRWENPLPVPEWVGQVRAAANGERADDPGDNRRRIYLDGKGRAWISACTGEDGIEYVVEVDEAAQEERPVSAVREQTGSLREIGRCA